MKVLELYSGIGGMHLALNESGVNYELKASVDINTVANAVYLHNFSNTLLLNRNIENLTPEVINKLNVNTILMSPPCQPFTRNGLKCDIADNRSSSFLHLLDILNELDIENILIENVKGFENSKMRNILVERLEKGGFSYQEFILSPSQFGIPNSRHRYYCLAKRKPKSFKFHVGAIKNSLPTEYASADIKLFSIQNILEKEIDYQAYALTEKMLQKAAKLVDVCYSNSSRSCCFTKAYSRYLEGTGSVYCPKSEEFVQNVYQELSNLNADSKQYLDCLRKLEFRFFTPREVCRLMSFPEHFNFPVGISKRQKYMLLGNSVNITVVSQLIKILSD